MASKIKKKAKTNQERLEQRRRIDLLKKAQSEELGEEEVLEGDIQEGEEIPEEEISPAALALKEQLEALQKDGTYYADPVMPITGPVSFEELDAAEAARETAHEVAEAGWDAQSLVRNILNHPMMDPKAKATAIKNVGSGFEKRISTILKSPETVQKDLDVLSLESILAHDKRNTNFVEQIVDKAKLAMAGESTTPYNLEDKAHTRAALVLAAREIEAGGNGAVLAKETLPAIRAAAKKFGIEMTMKKDRNAIVIEKDASDHWRWIGWVSNNFIDTDSDIIAEVAHKEYVGFLDENPTMMPSFITWHTPGTHRESLPDFAAYENGFLIMSGKLTEKEAEVLLKAGQSRDLGMSHGTLVFSRDPKDARVITKYRMYEVSDLPLENAANPFTAIETLSKEADMNKLDYLAGFVGKERAEELIKQTETAQTDLTAAGVISKDAKAAPTPAATPATADTAIPEHVMKEIMEKLDIPALSAFVEKAQGEMEKVPVLEALVKQLLASKDEDLANMISPPSQTLAWSQKQRASEKDDNVLGENDQLLKSKPQTGWLSEATGTKPIPEPVQ